VVSELWVAELLRWGFLQEKSLTLDAEDVARTRITKDNTDVQVAVSQMQELENILGSNGTPKWN
jgi:hypothetical protein